MPGGKDAPQSRKAAELHVLKKRRVGDEKNSSGIFQLKANLTLAVGRIQQRGDAAGQSYGVIGNCELPRVGEENGDNFARLQTGGDQAVRQRFDKGAVFGEGEPAVHRRINQGYLSGVSPATVKHDIVNRTARRICEELSAKHSG